MTPMRRRLLLLPFLLVCSLAVQAQDGISARLAQLDSYVAATLKQQAVPGIAIAITKDGKIVYAKGFGYADLENQVPFTPRTVSRIGSISKTVTATAVMQLVEQEKINLDAEVQVYVPSFPKKKWPITVRQLLCHQGGVRHYKGEEMLSNVQYDTVEAALAIFSGDDLVNEPGTAYSYTTYGYNLLSRVVEAAAGMPFTDYVQRYILTPSGTQQTIFDQRRRIIPQRASFYTRPRNGQVENVPQVDQSNKWGGGGLLSTVEDLIRYAQAYDAGRLLKPATIQQMFTAQKTRDGKPTNYGLGWAVANENGRRRIEHTGGSVGATSVLSKYPEQGITIAILVNCDYYTAPQFRTGVARILFGDSENK